MQTITVREANQNFSKVIAAVERGAEFIVTKRGREVARLVPVVRAPQAARPDALAFSRKALDERLAKFRLPRVMVKFSREECHDES